MPADDIIPFKTAKAWEQWLSKNQSASKGIWLKIAKKESGIPSITYPEALEAALCRGWIDGQKKALDDSWWLQRFTPRAARSIWSKINRQKAEALIEKGRMKAAGLREVQRAKEDGRWDAAYDSWSSAEVPADLAAAFARSPKAKAFFETLDSRNRYAILFRLHGAKQATTREKRLQKFVAMLERKEKIHP
jgi:uncharacterized protein YdeI (YjbR/CyaY-like superfamily)